MKTLLLIDGNSILNRAYYGIRPLTTGDGLYTHAVYGMMNIILKHMEAKKPDFAAVAFDLQAPTFRKLKFESYKANRKGMPQELAVQLPYAKDCMEALGLKRLELEGYEADDILGTCAAFGGDDPELEVYVLTGDRDSFQLIRDNVKVLLASTGETVTFDRAVFFDKYGITPEQFVDVKALMGDSSDNIPGVPGIGEKSALKFIAEYGSLDRLYEDLVPQKFTPSNFNKLSEGKDSAYMSRFLAEIKTDVPLGITLSDLEYSGIKRAELKALLTKLELSSLIKRLGLSSDESDTAETADAQNSAGGGSPAPEIKEITPAQLCESGIVYCAAAAENGKITVYDGKTEYSVEYTEPAQLIPFFSDTKRTVIVNDSKKLFLEFGKAACIIFDISLAAYVVNPSENDYSLPRLALRFLGTSLPQDFDEVRVLYPLAYELNKKLAESDQSKLYYSIEAPLAAVLAAMEKRGFKIDRAGLTEFSEELGRQCTEYAEAVYFEAGHEFNINSTKQLGEVLYNDLGLPVSKKTKTGFSTDADTLEKLRPYHPIINRILEYRQVAKLKSTYADGLLKVADENGRIHTSFNQTVTATGRLSSSEPNLQNIPIRTELGRQMRKHFIPKNSDYVLVDADYSQIELRLLAAVSGDERMINTFLNGIDIHTMTASQVFGVPVEAVTSEQRKRAKAVNFGIVYGIGAYSLANDIGVAKYEADNYIKSYFAKYPDVQRYLNDAVDSACRDGFVTTIFGRRRYIPELSSPKKMVQSFGKRVAMNSPIQGAAADIIKIAMINVSDALEKSKIDAHLILQVHDELIIESHRSCSRQAAELLRREMESAVTLAVPLTADVGIGENWFEC